MQVSNKPSNTLKDKLLYQIIQTIQFVTFLSFCFVCGLEFYLYQSSVDENLQRVKSNVQQKLGAIAKNSSIFLDGQAHDEVFEYYDFESTAFKSVKSQLLKIKEINQLKAEIYTLRLEDEEKKLAKFVVMTDLNKKTNKPYIGTPYVFKDEMLPAFKEGKIVYTDIYMSSSIGNNKWMSVFAPFKEGENADFAILEVDIAINDLLEVMEKENTKLLTLHIARSIGLFLLLFFIQFLIKGKTTKVVLEHINKPLNTFMDHLSSIDGHNHANPLILETDDELQILSETYNSMIQVVSDSHDQLEELNHTLEDKVIEKTQSIKYLLDNTGQGFLSFDKEFNIQNEYSKECYQIFDTSIISGQKIQNILLKTDEQKQEFTDWMFRAFDGQLDFDLIVDLAIKEVQYSKHFYSIEYRLLKDDQKESIMMILTNITEQRELELIHKRDQSYVKMILSVLRYQEQFRAFFEDFVSIQEQMNAIKSNIELLSSEDYYQEFFRNIHTLKGTSAAFDMIDLQDKLHILESYLQSKEFNLELLKEYFQGIEDKFLQVTKQLKKDLGDAIEFHQKRIYISDLDFKDILTEIQSKNPLLYDKLSLYVLNPISNLFDPYKLLIQQIADQQEKMLHPLSVHGDPIFVNLDSYQELNTSLVHLFRNAVDHGIESPEFRDEQGKDPEGSIEVYISQIDQTIHIKVIDDGAGINPSFIAKSLISKGLKTLDETNQMTNEELIHSVFLPGFSSRDQVSETSGRGIGMDAVKHAVENLNGSIRIESELAVGSKFFIEVPALATI